MIARADVRYDSLTLTVVKNTDQNRFLKNGWNRINRPISFRAYVVIKAIRMIMLIAHMMIILMIIIMIILLIIIIIMIMMIILGCQ